MPHINQLRDALGLPPEGEKVHPRESHLTRTQQARKVKARAANKRARQARRASRLAAH